jgi:hypothetical protein
MTDADMEAAMELEGDESDDANEQDDDQFEDDEMLAQPDEDGDDAEDDGNDDEEDVDEHDEDGGEEEVQDGVDPNPNAADLNKDKDTSVITDEKATTPVAPVAPVVAAPVVAAKKDEAKKADTKPADKTNIQTAGKDSYEEIAAFNSGAEFGQGYNRVVPKQYTEMRDDRLMNSLISKYAREVKKDGKLTGQMFLNKDDAQSVSNEVLKDHQKHTATDKVDFEGTWKHFDINNDGLVEVERMPQFLRYLTNGALDPTL